MGLDPSEAGSAFYPIKEKSLVEVNTHQKKMQCFNTEDMTISGNFHSVSADIIQVKLKKCFKKDYCKSDKEIEEFFRFKFLLLFNN